MPFPARPGPQQLFEHGLELGLVNLVDIRPEMLDQLPKTFSVSAVAGFDPEVSSRLLACGALYRSAVSRALQAEYLAAPGVHWAAERLAAHQVEQRSAQVPESLLVRVGARAQD
jgi:hypothetical protein